MGMTRTSVSIQSRLDLESNEVLRVINASLAPGILDREPLGSDQGEQHLANANRRPDLFDEVVARLDVVDVFEDPVCPQLSNQQVVQLSRRPCGVLASIADEDPPRPASLHVGHSRSLRACRKPKGHTSTASNLWLQPTRTASTSRAS